MLSPTRSSVKISQEEISTVMKGRAGRSGYAIEQQKQKININFNYLIIALLCRLAKILKSFLSYTDAELAQPQAIAAKEFHGITKKILFTGFNVVNIVLPRFKPQIDTGEDTLKVYNHCHENRQVLTLLRYLRCQAHCTCLTGILSSS